jgi:hypothetical protein
MAEIKNNFIRSKMNKDLDARLIPNGEYRNAINAQISRSEGEGVGTLENILGNELIATIEASLPNLVCIGNFVDEENNFIYMFFTDNYSSSYSPSVNNFIYRFNASSSPQIAEKLVQGSFLNFSTQSPIFGINLLENLLFFTDNRNQPRKINVNLANPQNLTTPTYYTTEDQISVAKYNPYAAINLYELSAESSSVTDVYQSTMKDVVSKALPTGSTAIVTGITSTTEFTLSNGLYPYYPNRPGLGQQVGVIRAASTTGQIEVLTSITVAASTGVNNVEISSAPGTPIALNDELVFLPNPYYDPDYAGDSTFIEDKFVRFSYRFKFVDNEYSLIAPFTQITFIPKQDGYFLTTSAESFPAPTGAKAINTDQDQAVNSSIVSFVENKVNSIGLNIPLPAIQTALLNDFKIDEIDILYKESDGLSIKVVDTIKVSSLTSSNNYLNYLYTGKKPFKTLIEEEIARVYDKVPVRALAQESSGNRIIYGNFQNRHTPPEFIDFNVAATEKSEFNLRAGSATVGNPPGSGKLINLTGSKGTIEIGSKVSFTGAPANLLVESTAGGALPTSVNVNQVLSSTPAAGTAISFLPSSNDKNTTSKIEYPNSSLKTNRSYQVGVILSDRFGRSSDVILTNNTSTITVGNNDFTGGDIYSPYIDNTVLPNSWPGNSLKVLFNTVIGPSNPNSSTLEPGLYNGDITSVNYNPLGWYSYKIVVQQTEQEYYNVYAPGAIKGMLDGTPSSEDSLSNIVLINDNINKVPRDLSEVGPSDKTYRSSVQLFGRVVNNINQYLPLLSSPPTAVPPGNQPLTTRSNIGNQQYYPDQRTFTVNSIQNLFDEFDWPESGFDYTATPPEIQPLDNEQELFSYYSSESNPFLAKFSTSQLNDPNYQFGINNLNRIPNYPNILFVPVEQLCVLETEPVTSLLDIYYETSTSGLVGDLNTAITNELNISTSLNNFNPNLFLESITDSTNIMSVNFTVVNNFGVDLTIGTGAGEINTSNGVVIDSVTDGNGQDVASYFTLVQPSGAGVNAYNIQVNSIFTQNVYVGDDPGLYTFNMIIKVTLSSGEEVFYTEFLELGNVDPELYDRFTQPPTPAMVYPSSVTLDQSSSPPLSTGTTPILTMFGRNGAYDGTTSGFPTASPNTRNDLTWTIQSVVNSQGNTPQGTLFELDVTEEIPAAPFVQQCILKNAVIPPEDLKIDSYTIEIKLTDGGGAFRTLTVNANYGIAPTSVQEVEYILASSNEPYPFVEVQFSGTGIAGVDGFYVYTNSWSELVSNVINNTIVIESATVFGVGSCPLESISQWYKGTNALQARTRAAQCVVGSPSATFSLGNFTSNLTPSADDYGWEVS